MAIELPVHPEPVHFSDGLFASDPVATDPCVAALRLDDQPTGREPCGLHAAIRWFSAASESPEYTWDHPVTHRARCGRRQR